MEKKICKKCNEEKNLCEFYTDKTTKDGKRGSCKSCINLYGKDYRTQNKQKVKDLNKFYQKNNKEKINLKTKKWRDKNKKREIERNKKWKIENKEKVKKYKTEWKNKNKEKWVELKKKNHLKKYKTDPIYKIKISVRRIIYRYIKTKKFSNPEIIGCDYEFFKTYFEGLFTDKMCWENYGEWHIDHIIPLCSATSEEEIYKLNHYTNLRPLWAEENLKKGGKLII
jgi:hypothetical protein